MRLAKTVLSCNMARYYNPQIGRFTSEDPIGFWGGINFYSYVDNAPAYKIDPLGLQFTIPGPSWNWPPSIPDIPDPSASGFAFKPHECCDKDKVRDAMNHVVHVLWNLNSGKDPGNASGGLNPNLGVVGNTHISGRVCVGQGCVYTFDKPEFDPQGLDPCVYYCIKVHEWTHYNDNREFNKGWSAKDQRRFFEYPSHMNQLKCLVSLL